MATLEGGIEFTGSVGMLSAYRIKGSDKIILRKKGGPKKKQVLTSQKFKRTPRAQWRNRICKIWRRCLYPGCRVSCNSIAI